MRAFGNCRTVLFHSHKCHIAVLLAEATVDEMHRRLSLAAGAALFAVYPGLVLAQQAVIQQFGGGRPGIPGTAIGGVTPRQIPLATGKARFGAGTGGTTLGTGNATGGINGATRAGSGGINDLSTFGSGTGGIQGEGRGNQAPAGGIADAGSLGENTGGLSGSRIGAGTGGIGDLNSLGAATGGFGEQNAPRFPTAH
jgi:hypothetical protein